MDINVSQVGRNLAQSRVDIAPESFINDRATQNAVTASQQEAKGLFFSAEIKKQDVIEISAEQIDTAVSQLSKFVQANKRQLNFSVDEVSNKQIVKVIDAESGEIIRQIPSEEVLKLAERLQELQLDFGKAVGLLFNKQV